MQPPQRSVPGRAGRMPVRRTCPAARRVRGSHDGAAWRWPARRKVVLCSPRTPTCRGRRLTPHAGSTRGSTRAAAGCARRHSASVQRVDAKCNLDNHLNPAIRYHLRSGQREDFDWAPRNQLLRVPPVARAELVRPTITKGRPSSQEQNWFGKKEDAASAFPEFPLAGSEVITYGRF